MWCVGSATVLACSRESAVKCAASISRARQRVPYHFTRTLRVEVDEHWSSASRRRYRRRRINRCCCLSGRLLSSAVEPIAARGVAALPWRCDGVFPKRCARVSQQLSSAPSLKLPAGQQALRLACGYAPVPLIPRGLGHLDDLLELAFNFAPAVLVSRLERDKGGTKRH